MKLDKDCVRDVLIQCEKLLVMNDAGEMNFLALKDLKGVLPSYNESTIKYTIKQLEDAGFLNARITGSDQISVIKFRVYDITYEGHEFLDNIKNDNNWNKIKEAACKIGASSVDTLSKIAVSVIATQINNLITGGL